MILSRPLQVHDFPAKVRQCDRWLQELVAHDIDAALYLMFQLASTSTVGYSTSHALVCGTLCHILAHELQLPSLERDSLVRAAITMNIGMTALQDELASQRERPSPAQQEAIEAHPLRSMTLLEQLDVKDPLWLDVVGQHHAPLAETQPLAGMPAEDRLSRILGTIDRYAAMISPRKSRAGRSATDSVRAIVGQDVDRRDEVTYALVRAVGLCRPAPSCGWTTARLPWCCAAARRSTPPGGQPARPRRRAPGPAPAAPDGQRPAAHPVGAGPARGEGGDQPPHAGAPGPLRGPAQQRADGVGEHGGPALTGRLPRPAPCPSIRAFSSSGPAGIRCRP